jgi:hypothetical protein
MRLVKRQELMTLPSGTLFAACHQPWVFGDLELKLDTIVRDGQNADFWVRTLAWVDADDTGMALDRLDAMAADSTVSHPVDEVASRHGLYDDDRLYLVYEPADTQSLIAALAST